MISKDTAAARLRIYSLPLAASASACQKFSLQGGDLTTLRPCPFLQELVVISTTFERSFQGVPVR
jgi:hypothetical protein